jgi:DNA-binding MarR family transcriptional regulator
MSRPIDAIWFGLSAAYKAAPRRLTAHALLVAVIVNRFRGPTSLSAIRHQIGCDHVQLSRAVAGAERAGFLQRERVPGNRREKLALPTPQGRALIKAIEKGIIG